MPNQPAEILFGSEGTGVLAISVRGRAYKHSKDSWDGNWLLVDVSVRLPKFTANVPGMLRADELHVLNRELHQFFESLRDYVDFATHESWLVFAIRSGGSGRITVSGTIHDAAAPESSLKFSFKTEQMAFARQLKSLQQAVEAFPVIGIT